jgi:hypothetical protein
MYEAADSMRFLADQDVTSCMPIGPIVSVATVNT